MMMDELTGRSKQLNVNNTLKLRISSGGSSEPTMPAQKHLYRVLQILPTSFPIRVDISSEKCCGLYLISFACSIHALLIFRQNSTLLRTSSLTKDKKVMCG